MQLMKQLKQYSRVYKKERALQAVEPDQGKFETKKIFAYGEKKNSIWNYNTDLKVSQTWNSARIWWNYNQNWKCNTCYKNCIRNTLEMDTGAQVTFWEGMLC